MNTTSEAFDGKVKPVGLRARWRAWRDRHQDMWLQAELLFKWFETQIVHNVLRGKLPGVDKLAASDFGGTLPFEANDLRGSIYRWHHKRLGQWAAERIFLRTRALITLSVPLLIGALAMLEESSRRSMLSPGTWRVPEGGDLLHTATTLGVLIILLPLAAWLLLPRRLVRESDHKRTRQEGANSLYRVLDPKTPADLRDVFRPCFTDSRGRPVSQVQERDWNDNRLRRYTLWYSTCAVLPLLLIAAMPALGIGYAATVTPVILILWFTYWVSMRSPVELRLAEATQQAAQLAAGAVFSNQGGERAAGSPERARQDQLANAIKDKTPFIALGTTTGVFEDRGDPLAPNPNLPFGISALEACSSVLVLGMTGSGKTKRLIIPMLRQWVEKGCGGALVLDGKGVLPDELRQYLGDDYIVMSPDTVSFGLIEGLDAKQLADTFRAICGSSGGSDPIWDDLAQQLIHSAAEVLQASNEAWTLINLQAVITDQTFRMQLIERLVPDSEEDLSTAKNNSLFQAVQFFATQWDAQQGGMPSRQRGSVQTTALSWIGTVLDHSDLLCWAETEKGAVDLSDCLRGKVIGFALQEELYGKAAAVIAAMAKQRLYRAATLRGDDWENVEGQTRCLVVQDECGQLLISADNIVERGRSLGLASLWGTQTVESVYERVGHATAERLLGVPVHVICLQQKSATTRAWVAGQFPHVHGARSTSRQAKPAIRTALFERAQDGAIGAAEGSAYMEDRIQKGVIGYLSHPMSIITDGLSAIGQAMLGGAERSNISSTIGLFPLVEAGEINILLAEPNTALALVRRGGVWRADKITLETPWSI